VRRGNLKIFLSRRIFLAEVEMIQSADFDELLNSDWSLAFVFVEDIINGKNLFCLLIARKHRKCRRKMLKLVS